MQDMRDAIELYSCTTRIETIRIFVDGSTLIKFTKPIRVDIFQAVSILDVESF